MKNAQANTQANKKAVTVKPAKPVSVKPAKPVSVKPAKPETVKQGNALANAVQTRLNALNDSDASASAKASQSKQLTALLSGLNDALYTSAQKVMTDTDFKRACNTIATCDKSGKGIEQVKTVVKVIDVIKNLAQNVSAKSNNFNICLQAMLHNKNSASLSELIVSQSKQARETAAHSMRETFTVRSASYSTGTASSQASQVRQVLNILNFASVQKGKRNDTELNEYGIKTLSTVYLKQLTQA
jgi:hypothetical protein